VEQWESDSIRYLFVTRLVSLDARETHEEDSLGK
jgi:hypothetical protein